MIILVVILSIVALLLLAWLIYHVHQTRTLTTADTIALLALVVSLIGIVVAMPADSPADTPSPTEIVMLPSHTPNPPSPPTEMPSPPTETPIPPTEMPNPPTQMPIPPTEMPSPPTETPIPPTRTPRVYNSPTMFFEGIEHIYVDYFYIGLYEVTNEQFAEFMNGRFQANQCRNGSVCIDAKASNVRIRKIGGSWVVDSGYEKHPVTEVTWYGATDFCNWVGGRLPTSDEWYKAASWDQSTGQSTTYPWGDEPPAPDLANYDRQHNGTQPVGSYPNGRSAVGAYDMSGNVWEFVADEGSSHRLWYGGGWDTSANQINTTAQSKGGDSVHRDNLGFRCVR